ncbi:hypothetical protein HK405_004801 [Cladochytrium tenue]|nr:hypothetical protein HK405_004801 [Cladochytrium tenue]
MLSPSVTPSGAAAASLACLLGAAVSALAAPLPLDAASAAVSDSTTVSVAGYSVTAPEGVVGAVGILLGLFLVFFGFRLYKPTLFAAGFVFGAAVGYVILSRAEANAYPSRDVVLVVGSLACGLLLGCLTLCFHSFAVAMLGAAGGLFLALWILTWHAGGVISTDYGRIILMVVLAIAGALLAFYLERWAVIVLTSFIGSYITVLGIDCFAQTGFTQAAVNFLTGNNKLDFADFDVNGKVITLAIVVVVLTLIGIFVQHRWNRDRSFGGK